MHLHVSCFHALSAYIIFVSYACIYVRTCILVYAVLADNVLKHMFVWLQDELYMLFSESRLTLTSLVPVELRSHDTITEITEAKVYIGSCFVW